MSNDALSELTITKAPYLDGKQFAYSVTYDEALEDLFRDTIPLHQEFGIPGHLSVVVGQMGQLRNLPGSSFHGMRHMSAAQLREMIAMGWTVSSHSWSHGLMAADPYQEVVRSREVLEEAIGMPVTAFIVPGDNSNHPAVVPVAAANGYLSVYTVTDGINTHDSDLFALNRSFMNEEGFAPIYHQYDPYRWLHRAKEQNGWIVEYTHHATHHFVSPQKEISVGSLRRRFERVKAVGGESVWLSPPEHVVDYILVCRHTELITDRESNGCMRIILSVSHLPERVQQRLLTLMVTALHPMLPVTVQVEGVLLSAVRREDARTWFNVEVRDGLVIEIRTQ